MQDVAIAGRPICESRFFDIRSTQLQSDQTDLPVTKKGKRNCVARLLGMLRLDRVDHTVLVLDRHWTASEARKILWIFLEWLMLEA